MIDSVRHGSNMPRVGLQGAVRDFNVLRQKLRKARFTVALNRRVTSLSHLSTLQLIINNDVVPVRIDS